MADEREVDGVDEEDAEQTQVALAAVILPALLAVDPMSASPASFTPSFWQALVASRMGTSITSYLARSVDSFLSAAGVQPVDRPQVAAQIVDDLRDWAIDYTALSLDRVYNRANQKALDAEKPVSQTDLYKRLRVGTDAIARDLTTDVREMARHEAAHSLGAVSKVWRTRRDNRVRVSHGDLEGDTVDFNDVWVTINGSRLRFPGDPLGRPEDVINCRCRASYRIPANSTVPERVGPPQLLDVVR